MTFISRAFKIDLRGFSGVRGIKYRGEVKECKECMFLLMGGASGELEG